MIGVRRFGFALAGLGFVAGTLSACHAPGKPGPDPEVPRPSQVTSFAVLYKENCAACHGENGHHGISVSLANPVYLAIAGKDVLYNDTAKGGPGQLMPPFARSQGGTLTDEQIGILVDGMLHQWSNPGALAGQTPPPYAASTKGDPVAGQADFNTYCARCHRPANTPAPANAPANTKNAGPLTSANYLALVSDQALRTMILAGKPDEGMPDWRGFGPQPLTDKQITDIVAWLATQRPAAVAQQASHP